MSKVKAYKDKVASLGCLICGGPADLHHPRFASGMAQRSPDWLVIPLCQEHHQGGYSVHGSPSLFLKIEGTEQELLARTIEKLFGE